MDSFTRTISAEEANGGYVVVLKEQLSFFPLAGKVFELQTGRSVRQAKVETSRGGGRDQEATSEHHVIRWPELKQGDHLVIRKDRNKAGRYILQIRSVVSQREFCG